MSLNPFQQVSEDNYARLEEYLDRLKAAGLKLPSRGGKVNKSAVATACGFNRETFTQNKRFSDRLSEAVTKLGLEERVPVEDSADSEVTPKRDTADKSRITQLEQQLASVRSENYELRRRLARYEHATLTGKRVIP
ncbi:hypothetical protein ELG67_11085 [Rhizobium leguminosarum]|uniref:hypothetical protein n=1 Tax=Rhizobium leguminosarum TaxID=384 RepID=UPI00103711A9|nr:hypothetical protein [Rhizobium leguminosarum]TBG89594.1 hypothetical protein ELG67_11085 [Rhizobium leguminosarum]